MVFSLFSACDSGSPERHLEKKIPTDTAQSPAYTWTKVTDSAEWPKSYNYQLFSFRDTLWVFHPQGNWYSTDGQQFTKSLLNNPISNHAFLDYLPFRDKVLGLGYFKGNIETYTFRPVIFGSANMRSWDTQAQESNLPGRFFYHPFVFQDKIWIVGGEDSQTAYADIWTSPDGVNWTSVQSGLPFGKRANSQVVKLNNRLYLLNNDVWSSADGLKWVQETKAIVPGEEIFGYAALEYDGKIWLLGCNRNGQFTSNVLFSTDGRHWDRMDAPWSPRGGIAACVFRNKIYLTGGKFGGQDISHPDFVYSNDLWTLEKSAN
jgi:hypothetical protein